MLYIRTKLPRTVWIHSNITLEVGFPEVLDLDNSPYSSSFRYFINSWKINYNPLSYIISFVRVHLVNHAVSTKLAIYSAHLLSYWVISNHPVTRLFIVTSLIFKCRLFLFICMTLRSIIYIQSLLRGISTTLLAGNLPYFLFYGFVHWKVSQLLNFSDGFSNDRTVQILENHRLRYIHSWMKYICMALMQYITFYY